MAEALVRMVDHPDGGRYEGDIITVQEDGWAWGTKESKAAWVAAGNTPQTYPGIHGILKVPGEPVPALRDQPIHGPKTIDCTRLNHEGQRVTHKLDINDKEFSLNFAGMFTSRQLAQFRQDCVATVTAQQIVQNAVLRSADPVREKAIFDAALVRDPALERI